MQKGNSYTVGQWCDRWFWENQSRWSGSTVSGYCNLIYRHILPGIGYIPLAELSEDTVTSFYDGLRNQGLSARSVWCVHLLLRRCMDEAARDQAISYNPVRLCREPQAEEYKTAPLRLGQIQRYLNAAEKLGALPLIYTGLSSGLRQCELITLSWADFHIRCRYILKVRRLLALNRKAEHLLEQIPETGCYVFLNPKTRAPYQLHELYYLHKRILKQAGLPWVAFRNLQRQCMEVGI
ncbi:tyrosine-type recombinase/integrase [Pseudoflavonifractor phocaeensis]|uniref:tyrosine-type recombinase/integrase n=1 Tax=Pseudoflavonifractor phocaeensis TaxID=1870988 RepID=UPI0019575033|nr:integrase [Pseudoflavonifractor phocaeensis]MBM6871460.1 integrase [Pseudoflavonifractor phocaeensis]